MYLKQRGGFYIKIGIIGGDRREEVLIKQLAAKNFKVKVLISSPPLENEVNITYSTDLEEVISDVDAVIAPMSSTDQEGYLKSTFIGSKFKLDKAFFSLMDKKAVFFIGIAQPVVKKALEAYKIEYIELAKLDNLAIMNAIPTAEGAIKIAIEETPFTIYGSKSLIMGLGKVGLTLAWRLKSLGSRTYAATRNSAAIARGKDLGIEMLKYQELPKYLPEMNYIYNTIPHLIIDEGFLSYIDQEAVIIDLASSPGGTDFTAADKRGIKAILALGLPGKVAPVTAGKMLGDIIPDLIISLSIKKQAD